MDVGVFDHFSSKPSPCIDAPLFHDIGIVRPHPAYFPCCFSIFPIFFAVSLSCRLRPIARWQNPDLFAAAHRVGGEP
jgi:hypothetical protein